MENKFIKPPLGIIPKSFHIKRVNQQRFNDVCQVIVSYYNAGLKINVEWIEEYNELLEYLDKNN